MTSSEVWARMQQRRLHHFLARVHIIARIRRTLSDEGCLKKSHRARSCAPVRPTIGLYRCRSALVRERSLQSVGWCMAPSREQYRYTAVHLAQERGQLEMLRCCHCESKVYGDCAAVENAWCGHCLWHCVSTADRCESLFTSASSGTQSWTSM